jgi:hypothetical protein
VRSHCASPIMQVNETHVSRGVSNEDMTFMDTITSSWSDTKIFFKYGKLILMFFYQLF